jgi:hypothetical protein
MDPGARLERLRDPGHRGRAHHRTPRRAAPAGLHGAHPSAARRGCRLRARRPASGPRSLGASPCSRRRRAPLLFRGTLPADTTQAGDLLLRQRVPAKRRPPRHHPDLPRPSHCVHQPLSPARASRSRAGRIHTCARAAGHDRAARRPPRRDVQDLSRLAVDKSMAGAGQRQPRDGGPLRRQRATGSCAGTESRRSCRDEVVRHSHEYVSRTGLRTVGRSPHAEGPPRGRRHPRRDPLDLRRSRQSGAHPQLHPRRVPELGNRIRPHRR